MSQPVPNTLEPVALDEAQTQRLRKLYGEIRCLVCQNQSLADSAADLAIDLRHEVQSQLAKGSSDEEIKRWLVERYGDFVLYRPQMQATTAILWLGPFVSLAAGALVWRLVQRKRQIAAMAPQDQAAQADGFARAGREASLQRAKRLLNTDDDARAG